MLKQIMEYKTFSVDQNIIRSFRDKMYNLFFQEE